jgi:hypothetical protein
MKHAARCTASVIETRELEVWRRTPAPPVSSKVRTHGGWPIAHKGSRKPSRTDSCHTLVGRVTRRTQVTAD